MEEKEEGSNRQDVLLRTSPFYRLFVKKALPFLEVGVMKTKNEKRPSEDGLCSQLVTRAGFEPANACVKGM